jgi:thioredoxin-like negative regulator of GroEL
MKGTTKPKGIGIAAILAVLLLTGSMFASCVMAQPAQEVSDQQLEKQLQEITKEVQDAVKGIESPNGDEATIESVVGEAFEAVCDGLNAALGILKWYVSDDRIDEAQAILTDAAEDFRNDDITSGIEKLGNALSIIWDILYDYVSQIPGWLYDELVGLLNLAQYLIDLYG